MRNSTERSGGPSGPLRDPRARRIRPLMTDAQDRIASLVRSEDYVLFMKGTRAQPQCGFSARVVELLDEYLPEYATVDVLSDPEIREGIKAYSSWPTIPQLYVKGEFVGGCDIVTEMGQTGELDGVLGVSRPELRPPEIFVTDAAVAKLESFQDGPGKPVVRLEVTARWQYGLDFDAARPSDVVVDAKRWTIVMSRGAARKTDGLRIDYVEGEGGGGFKIDNPNEPPKVQQLDPAQLAAWLKDGKPVALFDVRTPEERSTAHIEGSRLLDAEGAHQLQLLDKDATLVFHCHHGGRSQRAAEQALSAGFTDVYNLAGGIDAWSQSVDSTVPRY